MTPRAPPGTHGSPDDPNDHPRPGRLELFEPIPPYAPRTEREAEFYTLGDGEMFLNLGPHHPSTHGVLRVVLKLDGERVVDLDPVLGYLHRGVEKLCEDADYHQVDQPGGPARIHRLAVLRVAAGRGLREAPRRRGAATGGVHPGPVGRAEPHRRHPMAVGLIALDPGGLTPILYSFIERDEIVEMLAVTHRRAPAVQLLPDRRRERRPQPRVHEPPRRLDDPGAKQIEPESTLLNENEIFVRRTSGLGGSTGRRRCGSPDRTEPACLGRAVRPATGASVLVYPELEFDVPTRAGGRLPRPLPAPDRGDQAEPADHRPVPDKMPDGPVMAKLPRLLRPRPGRAFAAVEGPRGCTAPTRSATAPTSRSG